MKPKIFCQPLESDGRQVELGPDYQDCVDLVRRAATRGLSREKLVDGAHPRIVLASGQKLGRARYDYLMRLLQDWGVLALGGDGVATAWLMEPDEAIQMFEEIKRILFQDVSEAGAVVKG